ncbi:hypothetical protein C3L33_11022, partial [Rhododendron williamsianum]
MREYRGRTAQSLKYHILKEFCEVIFQIALILVWFEAGYSNSQEHQLWQATEKGDENIISHSCIHDEILEQRRRPGQQQINEKQPIRIYLNYDAVGHSHDRDCRSVGDIVKASGITVLLGEPPQKPNRGVPSCSPNGDPPILGDCWYNCTSDDISVDDKKHRLRKFQKIDTNYRNSLIQALGQTADWFRRALAVEPVKGSLRLSGYSACGQDGGVQLPREYVEDGVADADLVLLVTTRPTTGNTLAWAVACERDQWGRAIAGHVNVAPRHLTAEAETLLSATLIHEVMHVLGFDPHAFAHFRDERKRRRSQVTEQALDEKLGRQVTRVVLPRVVMHSRYHYGAFSENFTGLELEDGGGRGTSGSHWEKRLLMNEIMTGSVDTRSVVSKMTLALLEEVDGTRRIIAWLTVLTGEATKELNLLPPLAIFGREHTIATRRSWGQSSLADYCTYYVAYSDGSCTDMNSARAPDRMLGEVYGFIISTSWVRKGFYEPREWLLSAQVAVDGIWKVCPEAGGPVQFPGFNGELICPAYHELCNTYSNPLSRQCPNSCNFNGDWLMEGVIACQGFMVMTVVNAFALAIAMGMASAFKTDSSMLIANLSVCKDVLSRMDLDNIVHLVKISIQKCDNDGDNRLRVCHSACQSYNLACGASLDCSDQTLFSNVGEGEGQCTGSVEIPLPWHTGPRKHWRCHGRNFNLLYVQRACAAKSWGLLQHLRLFRGFVFKIGQHVYI